MTTDWLYPVNPHAAQWGYEVDGRPVAMEDVLLGTYAPAEGLRDLIGARHTWSLRRKLTDFCAGDRIWVRASRPIGAIVGLGHVLTDPEPDLADGSCYLFDVSFDRDVTRELLDSPLALVGDAWQSVRRLKATELAQITRRVPDPPTLPPPWLERYRQVQARQGQGVFRDALRRAYSDRCAVTDTAVDAVLEAAHIVPYNGPAGNTVTNGLLLRADVHTLFDLGLVWIDDHYRVHITDELARTEYADLEGTRLQLPRHRHEWPSIAALAEHRLDQRSAARMSEPRLLEPGRIVVLMPTARDGACPACGESESLRHLVWGMVPKDVADDPASRIVGCAMPSVDPLPAFECSTCGARFDGTGGPLSTTV